MIDPREHRRARKPRPVGGWLLVAADRDRRIAGEQLELDLGDAHESATTRPEPARGAKIGDNCEAEVELAGGDPC